MKDRSQEISVGEVGADSGTGDTGSEVQKLPGRVVSILGILDGGDNSCNQCGGPKTDPSPVVTVYREVSVHDRGTQSCEGDAPGHMAHFAADTVIGGKGARHQSSRQSQSEKDLSSYHPTLPGLSSLSSALLEIITEKNYYFLSFGVMKSNPGFGSWSIEIAVCASFSEGNAPLRTLRTARFYSVTMALM
jgi:hypothetical protein